MDLKVDLTNERLTLRDEILIVGALLDEHQQQRQELDKLTEEYQASENIEDKAAIAVRVMDLRIAIDAGGMDDNALEERIDQAFAEYDNALMDAIAASEPQPVDDAQSGYAQPQPIYRTGFPPITNKCPLCDGYKRAEFDFCRDCFMRRNPDEFDTCECGRTKHVRYEMCGTCHKEQEGIFN